MKLSEARDAYYSHSASASTVARQLGFAGIALVWVFQQPADQLVVLPAALRAPTILLILGLGLDLLQYAISALLWGAFARHHERRKSSAAQAPPWINWPALFCFWGKLGSVVCAYTLLLTFVARGISFG